MTGLQLGEGCVWDEKRELLYFIDIENHHLFQMSYKTEEIKTIEVGDYIGAIVLTDSGEIIAAVRNKLIAINPETYEQKVLTTIFEKEGMRFNDGKCDAEGNLWIGTMSIDFSEPESCELGTLYCIKNNQVIASYDGYSIPNGLAFMPEEEVFYHVDSIPRQVSSYVLTEGGQLDNRQVAIDLKEVGIPDGMTKDVDGNLWIAVWDGQCVACYDPKTGQLIKTIKTKERNTTCTTFGGPKMDQLYITTAANDSGEIGGCYVTSVEGVKGQPAYRYSYTKIQ